MTTKNASVTDQAVKLAMHKEMMRLADRVDLLEAQLKAAHEYGLELAAELRTADHRANELEAQLAAVRRAAEAWREMAQCEAEDVAGDPAVVVARKLCAQDVLAILARERAKATPEATQLDRIERLVRDICNRVGA